MTLVCCSACQSLQCGISGGGEGVGVAMSISTDETIETARSRRGEAGGGGGASRDDGGGGGGGEGGGIVCVGGGGGGAKGGEVITGSDGVRETGAAITTASSKSIPTPSSWRSDSGTPHERRRKTSRMSSRRPAWSTVRNQTR